MTDKDIGNTSRSILNVALEEAELMRLKQEAATLGVSMAKLVREYSLAYLGMKEEAMKAAEGILENPSSAYTQLLNIDARLDERIGQLKLLIEESNDKSRSLMNMLAVFIKVWFNHTDEVPEEMRDARSKLTEIRFRRFARLVAKAEKELNIPFQAMVLEAIEALKAEGSNAQ
jgi:hypothetical protein